MHILYKAAASARIVVFSLGLVSVYCHADVAGSSQAVEPTAISGEANNQLPRYQVRLGSTKPVISVISQNSGTQLMASRSPIGVPSISTTHAPTIDF